MSESTHSEFEDPDDNDRDKDYQPRPNEESQSSQSEASASGSQVIRPRKKFRNVAERKRTKAKTLRNTGKQYQGKGGELPKFRNLMELLPFIPTIHHNFYKSLPHDVEGRKRKPTGAQDTTQQGNMNEREEEIEDNDDNSLQSDYNE
uniref:Uncharacterized protein n=1 Tax=Timema douglasi TaxID=61478 RepID=A0A7R8VQV3_TIMDO|nr:unnamed protein product [Timema douglasi]